MMLPGIKRVAFASALSMLLLSGCSGKKADETKPTPTSTFKPVFESPVKFSADPAEKHRQQAGMVEAMLQDPMIPLDMIEGEAARRGVVLTDAQRAAKRRQTPAKVPPARVAPDETPGNATGAATPS